MADTTLRGLGVIQSTDYHHVKWVGETKSGKAVTIDMPKAINLGNIEWTFAEKDDTVASITFTGVYTNTNAMVASNADKVEPYTITLADGIASGATEIILGVGLFYIDDVAVALTRGGGSFSVEREFREIAADGDRGAVEGRIVMESSRPTLTMNVLSMITKVSSLYTAIGA